MGSLFKNWLTDYSVGARYYFLLYWHDWTPFFKLPPALYHGQHSVWPFDFTLSFRYNPSFIFRGNDSADWLFLGKGEDLSDFG